MRFLPIKFIERIGALQASQYIEGVGYILSHTQKAIGYVQDYIWFMADHSIGGDDLIGGNKKKFEANNVKCRVIIQGGNIFNVSNLHYK